MKKILIYILLVLCYIGYSQSNPIEYKVDFKDTIALSKPIIFSDGDTATLLFKNDSVHIVMNGDTVNIERGTGSESDPIFSASVVSEITAQDTTNWNNAYEDTINLSDVIPLINYDSLQAKTIKIDSLLIFPSGDTLKDAYALNDSVMAVFNEDTLCWLGCSGTGGGGSSQPYLYDQTFDDTIRLAYREITYNRIRMHSTDTILVDTAGALNGCSGVLTLLGDTATSPYFDTANIKLKGLSYNPNAINYYTFLYQDSILFLNNHHTFAYTISIPLDSLTFLTNNGVTDDAAGGWTGDDATPNDNYVVTNQYLASGDTGYFQMYYSSTANGYAFVLGFDTDNTNEDYTGWAYGGLQTNGSPYEIFYILAGSFSGNGTGTNSDDSGEWLRMRRDETNTVTLEYSTNGTSWSLLHSFGTVTGNLYCKLNLYDNTVKIEQFYGYNLTTP